MNAPARPRRVPGTPSAHHHGTHRSLLRTPPSGCFPLDVDAIIVPTARHATTLGPAIDLAGKLGCTLVVLCSGWSEPERVARLVRRRGVRLIAVDLDGLPRGVVPSFATCGLLAGTKFARHTDTSLKRNLGLLLARLTGWERVVFLDDDIEIPEPLDLREAAGLTERFAGVGISIDGVTGMPDHSVVCHAFLGAGGRQEMFIGGGALAVGERAMTSFFPNIYNEDWFFLLDDDGLSPTTTTGRAVQKPYDPFLEERARREELGDCLAEGLFWLLDNGRSPRDADLAHWRGFLRDRAGFITDVIGMVEGMRGDPGHRRRVLSSLLAARGRCQSITPELCVDYVDAWRADRVTWRRHLTETQRALVTRKKRSKPERRSLKGVRETFRALDFADGAVRLHLPQERFHHDPTDFDLALSSVVGQ